MIDRNLTRRTFLKGAAGIGAAGAVLGPARHIQADGLPSGMHPAHPRGTAEHCIFLWLGGGAAQIDTFDPKRQSTDGRKDPGSAYASIPCAIPGESVCEHLAATAPLLDRGVLVHSMFHDEVDEHAAAAYRLHVGRPTSGTVVYPSLGSVIVHEKGALDETVPAYVLMGQPTPGRSPGFLGPKCGFVYLTDTASGPKGLLRPSRIRDEQHRRRMELLKAASGEFTAGRESDRLIAEYVQAARQGFRLAGPEFLGAFDLDNEPASLRESYGDEFGQRCLLARRLVERGSRFVEVSFNLGFVNGTGWDTHNAGQQKQHVLIQSLDRAFSTLLLDLERTKLLEKTLIVVATEFGRPAKFDAGGGRGHYADAFTCVLAGGGLRTGQVVGRTDELAMHAEGRRVSVPDFFATIYAALGIDPAKELFAGDRPVPITDRGQPIETLFA